MTINPNTAGLIGAAAGFFGAGTILPPGTNMKSRDAMIVRGCAAMALYFMGKKFAASQATPAPVNGLGYMPNVTLDYNAISGGLGFSLSKAVKKVTKKVKKVTKKVASKSPAKKLVDKVLSTAAKNPVTALVAAPATALIAIPAAALTAKKPKKLTATQAKKLKAAQIKAIKVSYKQHTIPQTFATTTLAQLVNLLKKKMISKGAYNEAYAFILRRDIAIASGMTTAQAVAAAPQSAVYTSPTGQMISSGEYSSGSGQSFTDTVYTSNDQGAAPSSGSGQSFSDPNISYSYDESDATEPTERFDAAPSGAEQEEDGTEEESYEEEAPAGGRGPMMAAAAAAAAGAFWLFKRH